ncbi:MAG: hypothetical protein NZ902_02570 [Acidilobaceae archaeon]|nr:hypothetical protein [Acidilobaceae archaeon]MDW7974129.1 hypothetical protein [Sulfolobales archaeon]
MSSMVDELKGIQAELLEERKKIGNLEKKLASLSSGSKAQAELYAWKTFLDFLLFKSTAIIRYAESGSLLAASISSCELASKISSKMVYIEHNVFMSEARTVIVNLLHASRALCSLSS